MGKQWKQWETLVFWAPKITADGHCSHEIKRRLLLERKVITNLDSILKSRDIALPTKVHLVKALIFPVVMYGCESWTIKKAEHQRIDAFELWCWRRLLRVPWTARRSNQSILKENQSWIFIRKIDAEAETPILWLPDAKNWLICKDPDAEAEAPILWPPDVKNWKRPWCWERLKTGAEGDNRGWDGWMASLTWWTWVWVNSGSWWWTGRPGMLRFMGSQRVGHDWVTDLIWKSLQVVTAALKLKDACSLEEKLWPT